MLFQPITKQVSYLKKVKIFVSLAFTGLLNMITLLHSLNMCSAFQITFPLPRKDKIFLISSPKKNILIICLDTVKLRVLTLEVHACFFKLLMKGIFDAYVLWPFDKKNLETKLRQLLQHEFHLHKVIKQYTISKGIVVSKIFTT